MPKKKLALALSGCGARAVMYFAMLEVLDEEGIEIDMISACSSATFIACSYASGTLKEFKEFYFKLGRKELAGLFKPSFNGGLLNFDAAAEVLKPFIPYENLEDLPMPVSIVASDIRYGDKVVLSVGNIIRAIKASCCMPGLFEPVIWGDRILIDGGLFHIVPTEAARSLGADIVVGVDLATTRNLFKQEVLYLKRGYNVVAVPFRELAKLKDRAVEFVSGNADRSAYLDEVKMPGILSILDKSMDYAMDERKKTEYFDCDLIIKPNVKGFKDVDMGNREAMYLEGRRATLEALPKIKELLK